MVLLKARTKFVVTFFYMEQFSCCTDPTICPSHANMPPPPQPTCTWNDLATLESKAQCEQLATEHGCTQTPEISKSRKTNTKYIHRWSVIISLRCILVKVVRCPLFSKHRKILRNNDDTSCRFRLQYFVEFTGGAETWRVQTMGQHGDHKDGRARHATSGKKRGLHPVCM